MECQNYRDYDAFLASRKQDLERLYMLVYGLRWQVEEQRQALTMIHEALDAKKQLLKAFQYAPLVIMQLIPDMTESYYFSNDSMSRIVEQKAYESASEVERAIEELWRDADQANNEVAMLNVEFEEAMARIAALERCAL